MRDPTPEETKAVIDEVRERLFGPTGPFRADYKGATPKQVAAAVIRYRPSEQPIRHREKVDPDR